MANFDEMKFAVESISGGKNTVVLDDVGMPSVMVRLPKMKLSDIMDSGPDETHPAWILNGAELDSVLVSKYLNIVSNNRAYSLPFQDPRANVNFDQSLTYCRNKGNLWGLIPFSLWGAIALWSKKNGTMPRGNNNYGKDHAYPLEVGTASYKEGARVARTATGSGPATWNHNWLPDGIADLNGNVWDWNAGCRLFNGEIQIIPNADCMLNDCDMGAASTEWKAILQDGSLVTPGTLETLKINGSAVGNDSTTGSRVGSAVFDIIRDKPSYTGGETNNNYSYLDGRFEDLTTASGVTIPKLLIALGLFKEGTGYEGDYFYARNYGERLPIRGGRWGGGAGAGVFCSHFGHPRSDSYAGVGFRSAFYGEL